VCTACLMASRHLAHDLSRQFHPTTGDTEEDPIRILEGWVAETTRCARNRYRHLVIGRERVARRGRPALVPDRCGLCQQTVRWAPGDHWPEVEVLRYVVADRPATRKLIGKLARDLFNQLCRRLRAAEAEASWKLPLARLCSAAVALELVDWLLPRAILP